MKTTFLITALLLSACSSSGEAANKADAKRDPILCEFDFNTIDECRLTIDRETVQVTLNTLDHADDERELTHIVVHKNDGTVSLPISPGVSLIEGDRGYIIFDDINFDQRHDMAITTSFGVANLYLDYWTVSENAEQFDYVGNFPRLTVDADSKTLKSEERVSAAVYQQKVWRWEGDKLLPLDTH